MIVKFLKHLSPRMLMPGSQVRNEPYSLFKYINNIEKILLNNMKDNKFEM